MHDWTNHRWTSHYLSSGLSGRLPAGHILPWGVGLLTGGLIWGAVAISVHAQESPLTFADLKQEEGSFIVPTSAQSPRELEASGWMDTLSQEALGEIGSQELFEQDPSLAERGLPPLEELSNLGAEHSSGPTPRPLGTLAQESAVTEIPVKDSSISTATAAPAFGGPRWSVTAYGGVLNSVNVQESLLLTTDLENSYIVGIGATQALLKRRTFNIELDAQLLKHFGDQSHGELTTAVSFRWKDFFWDRWIDTSLAIGQGLSFATATPAIETERNGKSSQLLNYLMFEFAFALPRQPDWELALRMGHRSGVYGLFNGVSAGSNLYSAGLRRRF